MLVWRNGRRTGLKIPRWQHRVGSTPTTSTRGENCIVACFRFFKAKSCALTFVFASRAKRKRVRVLRDSFTCILISSRHAVQGNRTAAFLRGIATVQTVFFDKLNGSRTGTLKIVRFLG